MVHRIVEKNTTPVKVKYKIKSHKQNTHTHTSIIERSQIQEIEVALKIEEII